MGVGGEDEGGIQQATVTTHTTAEGSMMGSLKPFQLQVRLLGSKDLKYPDYDAKPNPLCYGAVLREYTARTNRLGPKHIIRAGMMFPFMETGGMMIRVFLLDSIYVNVTHA